MSLAPEPYFPQGLVIYLRGHAPDGSLLSNVQREARSIEVSDELQLIYFLNMRKETIAVVPRDFLALILPLETVGPAGAPDANNQSN